MNAILKCRAERLMSRRQEDVKDQAAEYTATKVVPLGTQVQDGDPGKQRRAAEREARRARRRRARESRLEKNHNEGMSTDDEENNTEIVKFRAERGQIDVPRLESADFSSKLSHICRVLSTLSFCNKGQKFSNFHPGPVVNIYRPRWIQT